MHASLPPTQQQITHTLRLQHCLCKQKLSKNILCLRYLQPPRRLGQEGGIIWVLWHLAVDILLGTLDICFQFTSELRRQKQGFVNTMAYLDPPGNRKGLSEPASSWKAASEADTAPAMSAQ